MPSPNCPPCPEAARPALSFWRAHTLPGRAWLLALLLLAGYAPAQALAQQTLDEIVAVVDDEIILETDVWGQVEYIKQAGQRDDGTLYCQVMEELLITKMLLVAAQIDSLTVNDQQVEQELERRTAMMIRQMGSVKEFERVNGKSLVEFKIDMRPIIYDQLLAQQKRMAIMQDVELTPKEVQTFFEQIPKDSLPFITAEVEVSQIVILPRASQERQARTQDELRTLRKRILNGELTFEEAAEKFSDDPGSAQQGGSLGSFGRGQMVPEFEDIAFTLDPGQISEVFETDFGFHILRVNEKEGDQVNASHILMKTRVLTQDGERAKERLEELLELINTDSMTFGQVAMEYSDDPMTADNAGQLMDPQTGEPALAFDQLDNDAAIRLAELEPGEMTEPHEYYFRAGNGQLQRGYRVMKLHRRTQPHKANLDDDYPRFYDAAMQNARAEAQEDWVRRNRNRIYVSLRSDRCRQALARWYGAETAKADD